MARPVPASWTLLTPQDATAPRHGAGRPEGSPVLRGLLWALPLSIALWAAILWGLWRLMG